MGDFDDGMEMGLWGADGIPYSMDEEDNTELIKKLENKLQILKINTPNDTGRFSLFQIGAVIAATILGYGIVGLVVIVGIVLYNEPKVMAYNDHKEEISKLEQRINSLYAESF